MELTCIIIDDEFHAQIELKDALEKVPSISVNGSFENISNALNFLEDGDIDIIFCDINLPDLNGLEAARLLQLNCKYLIYVTAHREYALDAFGAHADGYLLKPISQRALLDKIAHIIEVQKVVPTNAHGVENFVFVKGNSKNSFIKLDLNKVVFIEAMLNYVKIWLEGSFHITYSTLKSMERKLDGSASFIRISKSIIINSSHINEVDGMIVRMTDGNKFSIGDSYKSAFVTFLNKRTLGV
ncbi:LytR/AlgR family response regulator transcription factor [Sphingobacterium endophyticum]|uniref:LytR/AlgR family response regulator transcription factor n=1 Tax=Sphingobacterium endophyticum TaxID=2546448 RepID=UPI0012E13EE1|nr:response regulator transcription factor [Sphingobacterium endophyticum]